MSEGPVAEAVPESGLRWAMRALRHRDFALFWSGALASNIGSWMQGLTVPYVLFEITGSALWVGLVTVAQYLPMVLMSPLGGSIADRASRRTVLILTQSAMAVTATMLWLAWVAGVRAPAVLLLILAAGGLINGINMPSWQAYVSDLVPRRDLLSAVTLNSLQFNAARAIGPSLAGLMLAFLGPAWAFGLNALSFGFVILALVAVRTRTLRTPDLGESGALRQFAEAVRYAWSVPGLVVIMVVSVLVGFLGNPVFSFTVVLAGDVYGVGPVALGVLTAMFGVGAVIAAPIVSGRGLVPLSSIIRVSLVAYGTAITVLGLIGVYWVGLVALLFVGGCFLAVIGSVNTGLQLIVEERLRGRVMALRLALFTLSMPLGGFVQGAIADRVGVQATMTSAGVLLLVAAVLLARAQGRYRLATIDDYRLT